MPESFNRASPGKPTPLPKVGTAVQDLQSQNASLMSVIDDLKKRLSAMEEQFREMGYTTKRIVQSEIAGSYTLDAQAPTMFGLQLGLCVSTIDPLKMNRVRFYHPGIHKPKIPLKALPFAYPTSTGFPSFDDSGVCWVPPAGTTLALMFQNGNRDAAFYIGSIWNRNRGNPPSWYYPIQEYENIWSGTRKGYLVGKDDETQVFPPWNTWNYNGFDTDTEADFENDPEAKKRITYPHIYGIKTPEKAYIRWHDGDRNCNLRWKHTEIMSSRGNFILMKDDHLHPAGQWAHPSCVGNTFADASLCSSNGVPVEIPACCKCGFQGCPGGPTCLADPAAGLRGANKYFKRAEECRPYSGSPTPLNPRAWLPQSGIHMQSLSGHHFEFDDSVEQPTGKPTWDRHFDFGCTNRFLGRMWLMSATGHSLVFNDHEDLTENRSNFNYIRLLSAAGNRIELNDHTVDGLYAGEERGIQMNTTSKHLLYMIDQDNPQTSPKRTNGGVPTNQAKNAYCIFRTGYGSQLYMNDFHSQQTADRQFVQLLAPQTGNDRKAHVLHMQVSPSGPGTYLIRSGGVLYLASYDSSFESVGQMTNPADKFVDVTGTYFTHCEEAYVNINRLTYFKADEFIVLAAGLDAPIPPDPNDGAEVANKAVNTTVGIVNDIATTGTVPQTVASDAGCGPLITLPLCLDPVRGVIVFSDRVLISTSPKAPCCPLQLFVGTPQNRSVPEPGKTCAEQSASAVASDSNPS